MGEETKLTVEDFAARLDEILDRVTAGERFAIEEDGEVVATIGPPAEKRMVTLRQLAEALAKLPPLDDDFAADVEQARSILRPTEIPEWPD